MVGTRTHVCMYVCMYVCMHVRMYARTYVCICVYLNNHIYIYISDLYK